MAETEIWRMFAHSRKGSYEHLGEQWWVEIHGMPDPIVEVEVREVAAGSPDGTHWGWIDADGRDGGKPIMIWAFRGAFDAQFPYGPAAEVERGKGRVVRLAVREVPDNA